MSSLAALGGYKGSDSESDEENSNCLKLKEEQLHLTAKVAPSEKQLISATPNVITKYDLQGARCIDTSSGEVVFNPTVEELYTPEQV